MSERTTCGLCGNQDNLCRSHIVPRFVVARLKKESPTPHLRGGANPSVRIQDGPTLKLLCRSCEERLCGAEQHFALSVFHPVLDRALPHFTCDEQHRYFAASIAWRNIVCTLDGIGHGEEDEYTENDHDILRDAELRLRMYLVGGEGLPDDLEQHIFFCGITENPTPGINVLLRCANAIWIPAYNDGVYSIGLFCGVIVVGLLHLTPEKRSEWRGGTLMSPGSIIRSHHQEIRDGNLGFAIVKAAELESVRKESISRRQREVVRISNASVSPESLAVSPHLRAMLQDRLNERRKVSE